MTSAPDLSDKVLGFRMFNVADDGLCAVGVGNFHWLPGPNHARCLARWLHDQRQQWVYPTFYSSAQPSPAPKPTRHDAPAPNCNCGLYALHEMPFDWLDGGLGKAESSLAVAAAVRAWGRMEIHRSGFRAEYAEVALLAYDPFIGVTKVDLVHRVAERFGVRAVSIEDLDREARLLARSVPADLLPEKPKPAQPALVPGPAVYLSSSASPKVTLTFPSPDKPGGDTDVAAAPLKTRRTAATKIMGFGWLGIGCAEVVAAVGFSSILPAITAAVLFALALLVLFGPLCSREPTS